MDKGTKRLIKSRLRLCFAESNRKTLCNAKHRVARGIYRCPICTVRYSKDRMEYDHVVPVFALLDRGDENIDWNGVIDRMFNPSNLQMLCKECHVLKTSTDRILKKYSKLFI